jgi:hypothetical protein
MLSLVSIAIVVLLSNFRNVQALSMNGIFLNELDQVQPLVSVEFRTLKNDTLVKRVTADTKGVFQIDSLMDGEYQLEIPAYDTFPHQWFSRSGNTRYAQYSIWIGPAMQGDTLRIILTMHPVENPPASTVIVQVQDSSGQSLKKLSVELLRQEDMKQVGYIYNDTSYTSRFTGIQPGLYTINVQAPPYPRQYYDTLKNSSSAGYFFPLAINEQKTVTVKLTMYPLGNGFLRGRCYTETSVPASGLDIALFRATDTAMIMYRDTTDNTGNFSFENIIEENYFMRIQGATYPLQWYSRLRNATVLYRDDPLYSSTAAADTMKIYVSANPLNNLPGAVVKIRTYSPEGKVESMYGKAALVAIPSQKYTTINFNLSEALYISTPVEGGLYGLGFSIPGYPYQFYNPGGNTAQDQYHFTLGKNETLFVETNLKRSFTDTLSVDYGYVSGMVKDSVSPLRGVSITIFEKSGAVIGTAITDSLGKFSPIRVRNSLMYLKADAQGYPTQYWTRANGVPSSTISSINMFSVPTMTTMTADIKVVLNPIKHWDIDTTRTGSVLSGQVNTNNGPVKGARVLLIENSTSPLKSFSPQHLWSNFITFTDSVGSYTFRSVPQGSYLIASVADSLNLVAQFYKNVDLPKNAMAVTVGTGTVSGIGFMMRTGCILKGSTIDSTNGAAIAGVKVYLNENVADGRSFETTSDKNGSWEIRGIPSGEYNVNFNHDLFMQTGNSLKTVQVIEGKIIELGPARFIRGGIVQGTVALNGITMTDTMWSIHGCLLLFPKDIKDGTKLYPAFRAGVQFKRDTTSTATTAAYMTFVSSACPSGIYKAVFVPDAVNWGSSSNTTITDAYRKNLSYTFLNKDTSFQTASAITIIAGDTCRNNVIELRSGYSVFGSLIGDSTTRAITDNYNITVYKKYGTLLMWVSSSQHFSNGPFEIPGLIDGEQYFLEMWAQGYPNQYWSFSGKNTTYPTEPFTLNVASGKLQLTIVKKPDGPLVDMNRFIALQQPIDTSSGIKLQWTAATSLKIDTFFIHARNRSVTNTILDVVPFVAGKTQYEIIDRRILSGWNEYCITGHGSSMVVRSDIMRYDIRQKSVNNGNLWIDVASSRSGIAIEWGIADTTKFSERDSVYLYKRVLGGSFAFQYSRSAMEQNLNDWKWSKSDSLKTFEYYVEVPSRGLKSAIKPFTLDEAFFGQFSKELRVGPGERYTTIQSAINEAAENDNIRVKSGTYSEQISFGGKKLYLYGEWVGGYPPVIDASGGTAITIPYTPVSGYDGWNEISGFKITNASIGVFAQANTHINRCLFTNSIKAVKIVPDSALLATAVIANPFIDKGVYVNGDNCTFIASKQQSLVMSVQSGNPTTTSGNDPAYNYQILSPLKGYSAGSGMSRSLFAYYGSIGGASLFPAEATGSSSSIWIKSCAVWQTPYQTLNSSVTVNNDVVMYDPQFKDQIYYLCNDSSRLVQLGIGYGVKYGENSGPNRKELTPIKDLTMFNRSVNSIELRWSAAPLTDSIVRYRIYRAAGDPALFYVNKDSLWDLVSSSKDKFPSGVDTFSTDRLVYIDGTIVAGQPYLYAVSGVDRNGNESPVRISATKPISSYFSNVMSYSILVKADVWTMISPWGQSALNFENNTNMKIYQWDPQKTADKLLSHYTTVTSMIPGNGYWVKSLKDTTITVSVNEPGKLVQVQDTLRCRIVRGIDGWNQISSPFPHRVNPGLSSKYVFWEWMADSLGYKRVSTMEPWKAYWVYTDKDTSFVVNSGNNSGSSTSTLSKRNSLASWEITVSLNSESGVDPENICGVIPSAVGFTYDAELPEPPAAFNGNRLYFINNDSVENGKSMKKLSYQFKQSEALPVEKLEWTIGIISSEGKSEITFNGIQQCPKQLGLFWMYKGTITDLRQQSSVTIEKSSKETYGYLVATANPKVLAMYTSAFSLKTPYPNPSNGRVVIEYVLPYQWAENGLRTGDKAQSVSVVLYDLAGRTIKTLINSTVPAGKHTLIWDGRSQCGSMVGSGVFILRFKSGKYIRNMQINRVR